MRKLPQSHELTWVTPYLKEHALLLAGVLVLSVVAVVFAGALMFTSGEMISVAATLPLTVLALHIPSLLVRIFGIGKPLLTYAERLAGHNWVLRATSRMRARLFDTLSAHATRLGMDTRAGRALGLLAEDIGHLQDLFLRSALPFATGVILYLILVVATGLLSPALGLLTAIFVGVAVVVCPLVAVCVHGAQTAQEKACTQALYIGVTDEVFGLRDRILAGRGNELLESIMEKRADLDDVQHQLNNGERVRSLVLQLFFLFEIVALFVFASGLFGVEEPANPSGVVSALRAFALHDASVYAPNWIAAIVICFFPLIEVFAPLSDAMLSSVQQKEALHHLSSLSTEYTEARVEKLICHTNTSLHSGQMDALVLENVSFKYEDACSPLLSHIDIRVSKGEKVALIGRSGGGKTSLAKLICQDVQPTEGVVQRNQAVCAMEQHPHMFNTTLRENLLLAKGSASDDELNDALQWVGLSDLIQSSAQGLDMMIEEDGANLSGGQCQRIAFARMLLADHPFLIFDEPFANLDPRIETELLSTLMQRMKDKTVLVITHHLQNVEVFDRVIFIEDGEKVLDGPPSELLRDHARFRQLIALEHDTKTIKQRL